MHITNQSVLTESGLIHFFKKLYNKPSLILTPIFLDPTQLYTTKLFFRILICYRKHVNIYRYIYIINITNVHKRNEVTINCKNVHIIPYALG